MSLVGSREKRAVTSKQFPSLLCPGTDLISCILSSFQLNQHGMVWYGISSCVVVAVALALLVGATSLKSLYSSVSNQIEMRFGRIILYVNSHRSLYF